LKAVNTQPAQGDGVVVVPGYAQKQNINQLHLSIEPKNRKTESESLF